VSAARHLDQRQRSTRGRGGRAVLRKFARERPGDGDRAGCVAGGEAGLLLLAIPAGRDPVVLAGQVQRARAGAVDAVLDEVLCSRRELVGDQHPQPGFGKPRPPAGSPARGEAGGDRRRAQNAQLRLVAEVGDRLEQRKVLIRGHRLGGRGVCVERGLGGTRQLAAGSGRIVSCHRRNNRRAPLRCPGARLEVLSMAACDA